MTYPWVRCTSCCSFSPRASPLEAGASRLRAAEALIETGRQAEGEAELEKALAFYRTVGATSFIQRGEQLIATTA